MENHQAEQNQLFFHDDDDKYYDENVSKLPPGYRFVPDDQELIDKFLKVIIKNPERGRVQGIFIVNLYALAPHELTAAHKAQCEDTWYFFTKRNRKYPNGIRPARAAGIGYWKQTNVINSIPGVNEQNKAVQIGRKITLDYCIKNKGVDCRTDWKMNEYRLDGINLPDDHSSNAGTSGEFDEWSLCKIYISRGAKQKNKGKEVLHVEAEPSSGTQPIAPQEHNEHFAGGNFAGQITTAASNNQLQLSIPREQYNGLYAGGPGPSSVQPSTNLRMNNGTEWIPNYSNDMANVASSSMNGMHYTCNVLLPAYQGSYPVYENAGYVQPLRSLPPNDMPTWSSSDINQSSSSISDYVTRSLPPNGMPTWSSSDINQSSSSIPDHIIRSLPPNGMPTWSSSDINQSSSSIPDHVTRSLPPDGMSTWSSSDINQSSSSIPDHVTRSLPPNGMSTWSSSDINQSSSSIPDHVIRSLPPNDMPTWSSSDINQSSSSISDHVTRSLPPNDMPTWSFSDINQSSSSIPDNITSEEYNFCFNDVDFTFDDFEFGNKDH